MQTLEAISFSERQRVLEDQLVSLEAAVAAETAIGVAARVGGGSASVGTTADAGMRRTAVVSAKRLQNRLLSLHSAAEAIDPWLAEPIGDLLLLTARRSLLTDADIAATMVAVRSGLAELAERELTGV